MNQRWATQVLVVVLAVGAGTCGLEDRTPEMRCRDAEVASADYVDDVCACAVASDLYPDKKSCIADSLASEAELDCFCPPFDKYPESAGYWDCAEDAQAKIGPCVTAAKCDETKLAACREAADMDLKDCGPLPDPLVEEVALCLEPAPAP